MRKIKIGLAALASSALAVLLWAQNAPFNPPDVITPGVISGSANTAYVAYLGTTLNSLIPTINLSQPTTNEISVRPDSYVATSAATPSKEWGTCSPAVDFAPSVVGQTFDYAVNIPAARSYLLLACVASNATPVSFHFEYPIGTKLPTVGSATIPSPLTNWSVFRYVPEPSAVALPAGLLTIRFVAETNNFNFGGFVLAQQ